MKSQDEIHVSKLIDEYPTKADNSKSSVNTFIIKEKKNCNTYGFLVRVNIYTLIIAGEVYDNSSSDSRRLTTSSGFGVTNNTQECGI